MTFRPPRRFLLEHQSPIGAPAEVYRFMGTTYRGWPAELEYWRVRVAGQDTPSTVGIVLLRRDDPAPSGGQHDAEAPAPQPAPLGGRPALQLLHQSRRKVVRVIVLDNLEAYAVRFAVARQPLDDELLILFDDICAAVEFPPK